MSLFGNRSKALVGIDIGANSVKVVELAGSLSSPVIKAWGEESLPAGAFSENAIVETNTIADTLNRLLLKSGVKTQDVCVAVSSSHAITKVLTVPNSLSEDALEEQVSIEALHFIPYPLDEVNMDFEVLGPSEVNEDDIDVLLVACRRSIVDDYIDLVEDLNLNLQYVDIDTFALERAFRGQKNVKASVDQPVALFDVGSVTSHLMLMDHERVIYSRHQNFGSSQLIKLVRREYGVSAEEAQGIIASSQPPGDFSSAVLKPFASMLGQEIERALQFFYSSSTHSGVEDIILSGACSGLRGLDAALKKNMRVDVHVLNPAAAAKVRSRKNAIRAAAPNLTVAYGLSMRGLS